MEIQGWKYYNHAAVPTSAPHEDVDTTLIENGSIWKIRGGPLLARWTTDFDCGYETNFWYVIKDGPFDIETITSNYRYKIRKGGKYFDVRIIDPKEHREALYRVRCEAFSTYPKKYRPANDKNEFMRSVDDWDRYVVFGVFFKETDELVGFSILENKQKYINLAVQKSDPRYEKFQLNAALTAAVLNYFESFLANGGYICDGARNVSHETNFQDYLEKYFGFRKAYCKLHIVYNPKIKWMISLLYPFRNILKCFDAKGKIHMLTSVLKMEEIAHGEGKR